MKYKQLREVLFDELISGNINQPFEVFVCLKREDYKEVIKSLEEENISMGFVKEGSLIERGRLTEYTLIGGSKIKLIDLDNGNY